MQITNFFSAVSSGVHTLNRAKQFVVDSERQEKEAKDKTKADADKKAAKDEEKRKQDEEKRLTMERKRQEFMDVNDANREVAANMDETEVLEIYDNIDNVDVNVSSVKRKKEKKRWRQRPPNWKDLTEHYQNYGLKSVKADFPEEMAEMPADDKPLQRILNLWVKDVNAGKSPGYAHRQPGYIFSNYEVFNYLSNLN